jgi:hypothetical protein
LSFVDAPLMGDLQQMLFCGLRALLRNDTEESASILGRDLTDLVSLTPNNRPFSEASMKLAGAVRVPIRHTPAGSWAIARAATM